MHDIKLVVFDLDGVLVDAKKIHFDCLNRALHEYGCAPISWDDHIKNFDGLPTKKKLERLSSFHGLSESLHGKIDERKRQLTEQEIKKIGKNDKVVELCKWLYERKIQWYVASNARRSMINVALGRIGIGVSGIVDPSHVINPKPSPEIYIKAMEMAKVDAEHTLILEDSSVGRTSARKSGAHVLPIFDIADVNLTNVKRWMETGETGLTVVVPMAGNGDRFKRAGFKAPKPFIDVGGKPLVEHAVTSLGFRESPHVFVMRREILTELPDVERRLQSICGNSRFVYVDAPTEGAACTALLAEKSIVGNERLLLANCDQLTSADSDLFVQKCDSAEVDGGITVFVADEDKWSFAATGSDGLVTAVAEKKKISDLATCGVYYWRHSDDFFSAVRKMVESNDRTNNEFYVCPAFNHAIKDGKKFIVYGSGMIGLGTPEDVEAYMSGTFVKREMPKIEQSFVEQKTEHVTKIIQTEDKPVELPKTLTYKDKKKRIAVCISGHMRCYRQTYDSLIKNVVNGNDVDFFIHTWDKIGYRDFEKTELIDVQEIRSMYKPVEMVVEQTKFGTCMHHMFRKINECNQLKIRAEKEGVHYDVVVRYRADLMINSPLPYDTMQPDVIYIQKGADHGGVCDQFAFGASAPMDAYSSCVNIGPNESPHPETKLKQCLSSVGHQVSRFDMKWEFLRNR